MKRLRNNKRAIFSDSEPDYDDIFNESTEDADATKQSPTYLVSNIKPSIGGTSNNFNGDHPSDVSNSSDDDLGDTPSATSNERDLGHRNSTIWSGNCTPSPIGGSKAAKRKADPGGIDPHNIISPPPQASNESNLLQSDDKRAGKHQRLMRGHGRRIVSYDMKHHPMDDVLRPQYSAKGRAKGKQVPEKSSDSGEEIDEDDTSHASSGKVTSSIPHRRRSSRNIHQSETPIYSAKWHPLDQMLRENASPTSDSKRDDHSKTVRKKSSDSSSTLDYEEDFMTVKYDLDPVQDADRTSESRGVTEPTSPDRRRSARVSSFKDAPPNYDMKYHVMDSTLRPKAAAKRIKSRLHPANKLVFSAKIRTKRLPNASPKLSTRHSILSESELDVPVPHIWSQLQNPYLNRTSLGWAEIQEMDRCVYLLQKGAPLHGNTSPQDWTHDIDKKVLFDEGVITRDELSSREGKGLLKARYESVRLGLQNFFNSRPEPVNKQNWILSKTEGFDVYNMKRGSKYWRHQMDSIVEGTKTSNSPNIPGFGAETEKHMTENHDDEATVSVSEEQYRSEAKTPTSMQHARNEGANSDKSCTKWPPALEVGTERTIIGDLEDDGELGVIIETEDSLIESMRGDHVSSSIMSDAALEELLFPAEHYLREESNKDVAVGLGSSGSTSIKTAKLVPAHPDKTLDELSSVASEAKVTDLNSSSKRGLAEPVSLSKEEMTSGVHVEARNKYGEQQNSRSEIKTRKRKSRVDVVVAVHEDLPGRTPLVKKIVAMNPASPGTDIPKENLEDDGLVEHSSQIEIGTHRTHRNHEAIGTLSTRRVRRLRSATTATPPSRSLFGGPLGSSSPGSSPTTR